MAKAKTLDVLPKDFIGPPTPKQMYNAAPGVKRKTSLDTDGARVKTQEEYSVIKKIAVAQHTLDEAARKEAAKKAKKEYKEKGLSNDDFNAAKDKYDAMTPEQKDAAYREWQNGLLSDLDSAKAGDIYSNGLGGKSALSKDQANALHGAADELRAGGWQTQPPGNSDALAQLLAKHKDDYNSFQIPFWNIKGAHGGKVWDPFWQSDSSVGKVGYKDPDGQKDPNPLTTPYIVADGKQFKAGDYALVTAQNGMSTFVRVMDANPSLGVAGNKADGRQAEMSPATYEALGYKGGAPLYPPTSEVKVQAFPGSGSGRGAVGYLTPQETQEAGELIKSGKVDSIRSREELAEAKADPEKFKARKAAEKKEDEEKAAEKKKGKGKGKGKTASAGSGIPILVAANTVFAGQLKRQVGKASPEAIHEGGGYLAQGSNSVTVENCPLPRIGDMTSDNLYVVWGQLDVLSA
ncbi:MAG: hypothetical protein QM820_18320 [Minicystis sp.]